MTTPPTLYTLAAESQPHVVEPNELEDALTKWPEYLQGQGILDAAVLVTGDGVLSVVGQSEDPSSTKLARALPWVRWKNIEVTECTDSSA